MAFRVNYIDWGRSSFDGGLFRRASVQKARRQARIPRRFDNPPVSFEATLGPSPDNAVEVPGLDLVVTFTASLCELTTKFQRFSKSPAPAGMLSFAWPKNSSGKPTDLNEGIVRRSRRHQDMRYRQCLVRAQIRHQT